MRAKKINADFKIRFSIKTKLILLIVALLLSTMFITVLSFYSYSKRIIQERILSDLSALVNAKKDRITGLIEQEFERATLITTKFKLREFLMQPNLGSEGYAYSTDEIISILEEITSNIEDIDQIDIMNTQGKTVVSTEKDDIGKSVINETHFNAGKNNFFLGEFYLSKEGHFMYDVYGPFFPPSEIVQETIGVIKIYIRADKLLAVLNDRMGLGNTGELVLGKFEGEWLVVNNMVRYLDREGWER